MTSRRQRFYREVSVEAPSRSTKGGVRILLDGKALKTPAGTILEVPNLALAEAIAREWREQESTLRPDKMILTKLANTALDRVLPNPELVTEQLVGFAKSEPICYRATSPSELVVRQASIWDPLLEWLRQECGVDLHTGTEIAFVEQQPEAIAAIKRALSGRDSFQLSGLFAAAGLLGSIVIALALASKRLSPEDAFNAAQLEEIYQSEKWGLDPEIAEKRAAKRVELQEIMRFLELSAKPSGQA